VAGYCLNQIKRSAHPVAVDEREHLRVFEVGVHSIELGHSIVNPSRDPIEDGIAEPVGDDIFNLLDLKENAKSSPWNTRRSGVSRRANSNH